MTEHNLVVDKGTATGKPQKFTWHVHGQDYAFVPPYGVLVNKKLYYSNKFYQQAVEERLAKKIKQNYGR